jgi:hypothetical protein
MGSSAPMPGVIIAMKRVIMSAVSGSAATAVI